MADEITIESNVAQFLRRFHKLPGHIQTAVIRGLKRALILVETRVRTNTRVKWRRGNAGLAGRLASNVRGQGKMGFRAVIGFRRRRGFPYELAQEFGARAKPGGAMAMPLTDAARRANSPRDMRDLFIVKKGGTAILAARKDGGKGIVPHYLLLKRLEPRLNFRENVRASSGMIGDQVVKEVKQAI